MGGEEGAIVIPFGHHQSQSSRIVIDHPFEVGCLECGVSDASWLDHFVLHFHLLIEGRWLDECPA